MLNSIIENVAANEELYKNIEFETTKSYVLQDAKNVDSNDVKVSTTTVRLIYQGEMLYQSETDDMTLVGGDIVRTTTVQAYDGTKTRARADSIANIREGPPKASWQLFSPHTALLADNAYLSFPLSVFLQGAPRVKSPVYGPGGVRVEYRGRRHCRWFEMPQGPL